MNYICTPLPEKRHGSPQISTQADSFRSQESASESLLPQNDSECRSNSAHPYGRERSSDSTSIGERYVGQTSETQHHSQEQGF